MIISPLTLTFLTLSLLLTNSSPKAKVLTLIAHEPWNVSAFSHHDLRRTSKAEEGVDELGGVMGIDSRMGRISLKEVWMRYARGMIKLCWKWVSID